MDIKAALEALAGQWVNVDQSHTTPPFVSGILTIEDGFCIVGPVDSPEGTFFSWSDVTKVDGHGITLEDPAGVNESIPDYPPPAYLDPDEDDYW